ncbi:uncharacterized protein LOC110009811 isoform X2 [Jatropha curcas]|uniref:uncharacterized protein LOC110009811 isoform X2 n=1 Tax=Jatropha curcas TaxID=180498 RepID=UPI0018954EA9|nr:uncharacterized protein LOC110009811 isoform X2 [Jatropha curcas]
MYEVFSDYILRIYTFLCSFMDASVHGSKSVCILCIVKGEPPSAFTVLKGALDGNGPVLTRTFGNEKINISVMRLANIISGSGGEDDDDDINQLFLHVDVSKPGQEKSLQFLCGQYPDALGIHSVSLRQKADDPEFPSAYNGPLFDILLQWNRNACLLAILTP